MATLPLRGSRLPVTCRCGHRATAPAEHAGKRIKCPKCKAVGRISRLETPPAVLRVGGPGGTSGLFVRAYDPATRTLEFRSSFREDLPAWITGVPGLTELVPGKGVPSQHFATYRAMHALGVEYGGAQRVIVRCVHEVRSVAHLAWLRKTYPNEPLDQLVSKTHSFDYASNTMILCGHLVTGTRLVAETGTEAPIGALLTHYERLALDPEGLASDHDEILARYSLAREDSVLFGYDVVLELKPAPPSDS